MQAFREQLCPAVVSALETVSTHCPVGVVPANPSEPGAICEPVLEKEAVYHSVAVAAYDLYDYIEFSSWCNSTLLQVHMPIKMSLHMINNDLVGSMCFFQLHFR